MKAETKICQNCKKDFTIEPEDFNFYGKIKVPPPTFCLDCRVQRKLAFLNTRTLFKRKCDKCLSDIISMYPSQNGYKVWCTKCYNDRPDFLEHKSDYDFSVPFFKQFNSLFQKVPKISLKRKNSDKGCEYANAVYHSKNVYLSYMVSKSEDIYYSQQVFKGNKLCFDCENIILNEKGYELMGSSRNYNSRFLVRSNQCIDSAYLFSCVNCINCFMCSNLRNKNYYVRNKKLSRREYFEVLENLFLDSHSAQEKFKKEFYDLSKRTICRFAIIKNSENCTGDFIENSRNTLYSFENIDTENSKYIIFGANSIRECYDCVFIGNNENSYEITDSGGSSNTLISSFGISGGFKIYYSVACTNCKNLLGCVGLQNKQYCILNKQYNKEEYEKLLPKIINHINKMRFVDKRGRTYKYGEFFPVEFSPFAYNESFAFEKYPLSKKETENREYLWRDLLEKQYSSTIESEKLPDSINEVEENIIEEIIACPNKGQIETKCTFAYRIMPEELRFYRLMNIPLPRHCPNCRYYERKKWQNPYKLWHRQCACDLSNHNHKGRCSNEFETSYSPDREELVYCKQCYQAEVY